MAELAQVRPIDPVLTNFSLEYRNKQEVYAADALFPFTPTDGDTGTYFIADPLNNLKVVDAGWSYTTGATRGSSRFTKATFAAQPYAWEEAVPDAWVRNWLGGGQTLKERAATTCMDKLLLWREFRVEAIADGVAPTTSLAGTARWDSTASNARADVRAAMALILKRTATPANGMIITGAVWDSIVGTTLAGSAGAAIGEMIKYTQRWTGADITPELVAQYFNVALVKPGLAIASDPTKFVNTTIPGGAGLPEIGGYMWDQKEVYVFRYEQGQQVVSYGQTFGEAPMFLADQYRDDKVKADVVRCTNTVAEKVTCSGAIEVIGTVIS